MKSESRSESKRELRTKEIAERLAAETEKIIVGKRDTVSLVLTAILSGGHVLLEDLPGSGKTTLVKTLSLALGCGMRRVQFTPDLLPADVTGMTIFDQKTGEFRVRMGPVSTNLLLADEINRAIPRTQAALLEAMEERQVTIDGVSYPLPEPFFVMATQNPVEKESTFPLPAAQMDRFFMKLSLGYPDREEEAEMLKNLGDGTHYERVRAVTDPAVLSELRQEIAGISVNDALNRYIVDLVQRTREHGAVKTGASPRASRSLYQGAKTRAAMHGRSFVTPEDIQEIALPVLCHRVVLTSQARYSGTEPETVIGEILKEASVPVPEDTGSRTSLKKVRLGYSS